MSGPFLVWDSELQTITTWPCLLYFFGKIKNFTSLVTDVQNYTIFLSYWKSSNLNQFKCSSENFFFKFIYSEKATNFCEISTKNLSYVVPVKYLVEISQNFVAFSEYINIMTFCEFVDHNLVKLDGVNRTYWTCHKSTFVYY